MVTFIPFGIPARRRNVAIDFFALIGCSLYGFIFLGSNNQSDAHPLVDQSSKTES